MKKTKHWLIRIAAISLLAGFYFSPTPVFALTVSPLKQTTVINPGQSAIARLTVTNDDVLSHTYVPEVSAFAIDTQTGRAVFGVLDNATGWLTPAVSSLTLAPKQKADLFFTINLPSNAVASSHYLGLFARQNSLEGQVSVGARAGSLLFLHVGNTARQELQWDNFLATPQYNGAQNIDVQIALKNTGTIHVTPQGSIRFFDYHKKLLQEIAINTEARKILPGGIFTETLRVNPVANWYVGPLTIESHITYEHNSLISRAQTVWYVSSQWFWFGAVLFFGGVVWGIFLVCRHLASKRKNRV